MAQNGTHKARIRELDQLLRDTSTPFGVAALSEEDTRGGTAACSVPSRSSRTVTTSSSPRRNSKSRPLTQRS